MACVRRLNDEGACATVDILGEGITKAAEAEALRDEYVALLREIDGRGLDANVSVKPSGLGLSIDPALCLRNVAACCEEARARGSFVRIDMEGSALTQPTLDLYRRLRRDFDCVGPVLQARLRRTSSDAAELASEGANVRLCKGIYLEPRALAWTDREIIQRAYAWCLRRLWEGGASRVGIATHDEMLVFEALRLVDELRVAPERREFQMLLGVEDELRRILVRAGHRVRVYVPYGERWYEYSLRRLDENPEIAGHVFRATVGSVFGRKQAAVTTSEA
jgi:proline dehydrogenase